MTDTVKHRFDIGAMVYTFEAPTVYDLMRYDHARVSLNRRMVVGLALLTINDKPKIFYRLLGLHQPDNIGLAEESLFADRETALSEIGRHLEQTLCSILAKMCHVDIEEYGREGSSVTASICLADRERMLYKYVVEKAGK